MFKFISKKLKKNNKGFTLVELIAVLGILAIIGAIAVPKFTATRKNAALKAHEANVRTLENAAKLYYTETGNATTWKGENPEEGETPEEGEDNPEEGETPEEGEDNPEYAWTGYLDGWPQIPEGLTKEDLKDLIPEGENAGGDINNYTYKVEIKPDGEVKVTIVAKKSS